MDSLIKALKFPFEQKNWESKLGVLFLFYLAISLVTSTTNATSGFIQDIFTNQDAVLRGEFTQNIVDKISLFSGVWAFLLSILLIPVSLYLSGYNFSIMGNVMKGKEDILEEISNIGDFLKLGLKRFILGFPAIFIYAVLLVVSSISVLFLTFGSRVSTDLPTEPTFVIVVVISWGIFFIFAILLGFLVNFINTSIYYNYLKDGNLWGAFNLGGIVSTLKAGWVEFLKVLGFSMIVQFAAAMIGLTLCCLSFIVTPALNLYTTIVVAYLYGLAFQKLLARKV